MLHCGRWWLEHPPLPDHDSLVSMEVTGMHQEQPEAHFDVCAPLADRARLLSLVMAESERLQQ